MVDQIELATLPIVSLIIPFYNEETILEKNIHILIHYLQAFKEEYQFEMILVDDGSTDKSAKIGSQFVNQYSWIHLISHHHNLGLGKALQTGFKNSIGDYVIVLDADLSYHPDHIQPLLKQLIETEGSVVIASPYMKGGRVTNVSWMRYRLSQWANRFLSFLSHAKVKTLTGMVRAYDGDFIRHLSLRSTGPEINPEIIYKAGILGKKVVEIPAHLCWIGEDTKKRSKLKIFKHSSKTLLTGFFIKPFLFFIIPGLFFLLFALYSSTWMFIHIAQQYQILPDLFGMERLTEAFKDAYNLQPHTFLIAFLSSLLAIQLISFGMLSLQWKNYFEELFYLQKKIYDQRDEK